MHALRLRRNSYVLGTVCSMVLPSFTREHQVFATRRKAEGLGFQDVFAHWSRAQLQVPSLDHTSPHRQEGTLNYNRGVQLGQLRIAHWQLNNNVASGHPQCIGSLPDYRPTDSVPVQGGSLGR